MGVCVCAHTWCKRSEGPPAAASDADARNSGVRFTPGAVQHLKRRMNVQRDRALSVDIWLAILAFVRAIFLPFWAHDNLGRLMMSPNLAATLWFSSETAIADSCTSCSNVTSTGPFLVLPWIVCPNTGPMQHAHRTESLNGPRAFFILTLFPSQGFDLMTKKRAGSARRKKSAFRDWSLRPGGQSPAAHTTSR